MQRAAFLFKEINAGAVWMAQRLGVERNIAAAFMARAKLFDKDSCVIRCRHFIPGTTGAGYALKFVDNE
ncbi:hypothetical protein KCP70_03430 [Salmonella enterica subsp. enterica]|nr:hypothetical protein KCP70_03430 [Salmonella enterica subsp. enterica]